MRSSVLFITLSAFGLTTGAIAAESNSATQSLTETNSVGAVTGQPHEATSTPAAVTSQPTAVPSQQPAVSGHTGLSSPMGTGSHIVASSASHTGSSMITTTSSTSTLTKTKTTSSSSESTSTGSHSASAAASSSTGGAAIATAAPFGLMAGAALAAIAF